MEEGEPAVNPIQLDQFKRTYATHLAPDHALAGYIQSTAEPRIGDLLAAEVISLGKHSTLTA
jgi:hypothetical protein